LTYPMALSLMGVDRLSQDSKFSGALMMIKLVTCLKRIPQMPPKAFQEYWRTKHAEIVRPLPGIRKYIQSHVLLNSYQKGQPIYDGVAEIWVDDTNTVRSFQDTPVMKNIQKDEPNFFLVKSSPLIITEEYEIIAGPERYKYIKLIKFLKRKKGMLVKDFQAYWLNYHGPMVSVIPGIQRYVQSHTRLSGYRRSQPPTYDGVASYWFHDMRHIEEAKATTEYTAAYADKKNFMELSEISFILTQQHRII
jgi:uncharacterized protein (TIGR02118 family)